MASRFSESTTQKPAWQRDGDASACTGCKKAFSFVTRKHHCRACGLVFCYNCSPDKVLLPVVFETRDPQRVCNTCRLDLQPLQSELASMNSNAERDNVVNMEDKSRYMNMPYSSTLGSELRKATYSLMNMFNSEWLRDRSIPARLLRNCAGIAFMTVVKAGFLFAGKVGTGLVVGKLPDGTWSGPTAIGTAGMSWGLLIGADVTDFVMILNNEAALRAFSGVGNVQIGAGIDVALGPIGRGAAGNVSVGDKGATAVLSYSHSKGLFAGITLDGAIIATRRSVNFNFYGRHIDPMDILSGQVPAPKAGAPLYDAMNKCMADLPEAAAAAATAAAAAAATAAVVAGSATTEAGTAAAAGAGTGAGAAGGGSGQAGASQQKQKQQQQLGGTAWGTPEETLSI